MFATNFINDGLKDSSGRVLPLGAVDGNWMQIAYQTAAVGIAVILALAGTLLILKICDLLVGVRCTPEHEITGLDLSMHGEEGYALEG